MELWAIPVSYTHLDVYKRQVLDKLVKYVDRHHMDNVTFIPYQDKANLIYSLNAADVHWVVNAKGIKGVSCPSQYYGVASCQKAILAVLEKGSEVRLIIEETQNGLVSEPGNCKTIEDNIRWFIENADSDELVAMGQRGRENLEQNLTKDVSLEKYKNAILGL